MKLLNQVTIEKKKSKFVGYFYEIHSKEEVTMIWDALKKEHKKAKHIPYAYYFENTAGKSDDKEPSNTAGTPLFYLLEHSSFRNHAIFVVRYFGGVKLGAGGLIRAYSETAKEVCHLKNSL